MKTEMTDDLFYKLFGIDLRDRRKEVPPGTFVPIDGSGKAAGMMGFAPHEIVVAPRKGESFADAEKRALEQERQLRLGR